MLIIYDIMTGLVISISGIMGYPPTQAEVLRISLVGPLPDGQAEYRIYNPTHINLVWEAYDNNKELTVILDDNHDPIGIQAYDGENIETLFMEED